MVTIRTFPSSLPPSCLLPSYAADSLHKAPSLHLHLPARSCLLARRWRSGVAGILLVWPWPSGLDSPFPGGRVLLCRWLCAASSPGPAKEFGAPAGPGQGQGPGSGVRTLWSSAHRTAEGPGTLCCACSLGSLSHGPRLHACPVGVGILLSGEGALTRIQHMFSQKYRCSSRFYVFPLREVEIKWFSWAPGETLGVFIK